MRPRRGTWAVVAILGVAGCGGASMERKAGYPPTRAMDLVETLHGAQVADPYRWLEDSESPEVATWTAAQNAHTERWLTAEPGRAALRAALDEAFDVGWVSTPSVAGERLFWLERRGDEDQPKLIVQDPGGPARVLLDVAKESADGTTALDWYHPSPSGERIAYGLSTSGDERSVLHVMEVDDGRLLPVRIAGTRASSVAWAPDEQSFHYNRLPLAGTRYWPTVEPGAETYHRHVYRHVLGADPADDARVFGGELPREHWPWVARAPGVSHLVVTVHAGWSTSTVFARPVDAPDEAPWTTVAERPDVRDVPLLHPDGLFLWTNHEAARGRVVRVGWDAVGSQAFEEVVAEHPTRVVESVIVLKRHLAVHWLEAASSVLTVHTLDGALVREVPLGAIATVGGMDGDLGSDRLYYATESYTQPPATWSLDLADPGATPRLVARVEGTLDPSAYEVTRHRTTSADGTEVTMFVVHRQGLTPSGDAPTVLYGYGGFNSAMTPGYSRNIQPFLAAGGVYAVAHLRGGGEYGEAWHKAGMLGNKERVFEDFEAASAYLVEAGFTTPARLAVMGGSNGGLLTGAATVRFPERFRAAVIRVPLLDMLRFHLFLLARLWIPEYGDPDDPEAFAWLHAYSPYHRVPERFANPAVFLLAAESDTRVHPCHARKFAAMLQARSSGPRPILLRIETKAGHGAGKPTAKVVDEYADIWTFLYRELGMTPPAP